MNLFPLWTAKVWPTNSGVMVEARDQVLMTFFWFALFSAATFSISATLTKGPFLSERAIASLPSSFHDVLARRLFPRARFLPLGMPSPRGDRVGVALGGFPLAAAVRVVDRVHDDAARLGADTEPAGAAGLADADILMVGVADRADRGAAVERHVADLAGGEAQLG